jgi:hypothetical protein
MATDPTIEHPGLTLRVDPDEHSIQGASMSARKKGMVAGRARVNSEREVRPSNGGDSA